MSYVKKVIGLHIFGQATLAAATLECCKKHFLCNPPKISDRPPSDVLWICYDTPIGLNDEPDTEWVVERIREHVRLLGTHCFPLILISSQLPVGTTARLEKEFPQHSFACQPENIRVASAVADFQNQERVVIGRRNIKHDELLGELFAPFIVPFTGKIILTDPESAEMVKHALNCYLGMSIAFANEIARVCKAVGADVEAVSQGLRTERRVSPLAPLKPGAPFGGGHLARDIFTVRRIAHENGVSIPIIAAIKPSNDGR